MKKPKQYQKRMLFQVATSFIDQWVRLDKPRSWDPDLLREALAKKVDANGEITYNDAVHVLKSFESAKMAAGANAGIGWIKDQWRKHAS